MMEFGAGQFGRWLLLAGALIAGAGAVIILLDKVGFFRLPGDLQFGGKNWRIFIPIASCILISIILTAVLWLVRFLRR